MGFGPAPRINSPTWSNLILTHHHRYAIKLERGWRTASPEPHSIFLPEHTQFALLELGLCEKSVGISLTNLLRAQHCTRGAGASPLGTVGTSVLRAV